MKMLMLYKPKSKLNDRGFASIVIALVLIVVLGLITVGFAQLARREQKSALNKQLSNQAYYAAETGINDALQDIKSGTITSDGANGTVKADDTNCMTPAVGRIAKANQSINSTNGVSYSCVLVTLQTPDIAYSNVPPQSQRYISFSADRQPTSLTVKWGSADNHHSYPGSCSQACFKSLSQWGNAPAVLAISLTPMPANPTNASLAANTFTAYLYPSNTSSGVNYSTSASGQGPIGGGGCSGSSGYTCSVRINGVPAAANGQYLIRIVDYYDASNISVSGSDASGSVKFNGQPQIDVTGKAHEVLKRLRVRVPLNPSYDLPYDTIEAQNACKRFAVDPTKPATFDSLGSACNVSN
jgi:hypothetical protein